MRAAVVYESMYGNTRAIAEAICVGLTGEGAEAVAIRAVRVNPDELRDLDLVILGAPTHAWGLSRASTRRSAADATVKPHSGLVLEPDATGPGMREWLAAERRLPGRVAVFDTRMHAPMGLSGSAARRIRAALRRRGVHSVDRMESFFVTRQNTLVDGEQDRARRWGQQLARSRHSRVA